MACLQSALCTRWPSIRVVREDYGDYRVTEEDCHTRGALNSDERQVRRRWGPLLILIRPGVLLIAYWQAGAMFDPRSAHGRLAPHTAGGWRTRRRSVRC